MNILITLPYTKGRGGIETVVTELLNSSFSIQNNVVVLIQNKEYTDWLDNIPDRVKVVSCFWNGKNKVARMGSYLWQIFLHNDFDLVIDAGIKSLTVLKKIRSILKRNYKIISWPHFSLSIYKDKERSFLDADYFWAISSDLKKELMDIGVPGEKIFLVYNPVSSAKNFINVQEDKSITKFIYVGRLIEEQKNLTELFQALGG